MNSSDTDRLEMFHASRHVQWATGLRHTTSSQSWLLPPQVHSSVPQVYETTSHTNPSRHVLEVKGGKLRERKKLKDNPRFQVWKYEITLSLKRITKKEMSSLGLERIVAPATLAEDLNLVLMTPVRWLITACNSKGSEPSSSPHEHPHMVYKHMHAWAGVCAHTYTHTP